MAKIFADLTLDGPESVHFDMTRRDFHVESAVTAIVKVVEDKSAEEDRVTSSNQKVQPNIIPQKST